MYKQVAPLPTPAPKSFDSKEFMNPGNDYRMTYSWCWDVELSREEIRRQIDDMADGGILNVYVLPEPPEFRPDFAPTTLSPAYLSDEFMEMVRYSVEYGLTKGVHFWLYDEGGWPSGSANGLTCKDRPDLVGRILKRKTRTLQAGEAYVPCEDAVAAFDAENCRLPEDYIAKNEEEICEYYTFVPRYFNNLYPDLLNPEATERFIEVTHERYREAISGEFGKSVPYMFTDEPAVHGPQWTAKAPEDFKEKFGYDLVDYLPAIFNRENPTEREMQVRMDYCEWWSDLFAKNYFGQLQSWCRENNLKSVGHVGGDDETRGSGIQCYGHIMRALRKFDVPGVDAIMGQILPQEPGTVYYRHANIYKPIGTNHFFPRFASSAASQTGGRDSLTESFGVYSVSSVCEEMRYVIGFQMVRGVNKINSMGLGYGRKGIFAHSDACHCVPKDPSYYNRKEFLLNVARQSYLLSLGDSTVETGMYLPVRDMWAKNELMDKACALFDKAGVIMEAVPCEFDIMDDDFLAAADLTDGVLSMGLAHYKTIVVPDCRMMPEISAKRLEAFVREGGKVYVVCEDAAPQVVIDGAVTVTPGALAKEVVPTAQILKLEVEGNRPPVHEGDPSIRVHRRKLPEGTMYYIFNEGMATRRFTVGLGNTETCYRLATEDGTVRLLTGTDICRVTGDKTEFDLTLCCGESAIVLFTEDKQEAIPEDVFRTKEMKPDMELKEFKASKTMEMTMTSDEVFVKECKEYSVPMELGDWCSTYGNAFSGRVTYETGFALPEKRKEGADLLLNLGEVKHTCEVWLNGKKQAVLCTTPYRCILKAADLKKENVLEIRVANSSANQHVHTNVMDKWTVHEIGPYYQTSVALAERDVPSGLFGPVTLTVI